MLRPFLMALVLVAGFGGGLAYAQSPGYPEPQDDSAMPSLTLPENMTNPMLSGLGPDDQVGSTNSTEPNTLEPAPYSVDGEEPPDPGGN